MFTDASLKKFIVDENNTSIGKVEVNRDLLCTKNFIRPFIRTNDIKEITKVGNRNYVLLDQYIIKSLNDYYNKLINVSPTERTKMLEIYRRLYEMWQNLRNFKISKNLPEIDKTYDLFSYELYLLGYED